MQRCTAFDDRSRPPDERVQANGLEVAVGDIEMSDCGF
jgi:hypothetical protein